MNEIKFRGQRVDNKEWVYGFIVITPTGENRIYWKPFEEATNNTYHQVIPETVGQQWVISEKKFFTGDLLSAICSLSGSDKRIKRTCLITFDGKGLGLGIWHKGEWWGRRYMDWISAEIIGNIHENPELIK